MLEANLKHRLGEFQLDVSIKLPNSGVCAVFGPSGSGKTTLLKALAGLLLSEGTILFGTECWQNQDTNLPPHERSAGFVFQDNRLFPHLNVMANLAFAAQRAHSGAIIYDEVIDTLGVEPLLDRAVTNLSGGEAKRVAIARALLGQPKLLLMDEPLNGLDLASKREILGYLSRLNRHFNLPTLYVSHDIEEVGRLCDHMLIMQSGRVIDEGRTVAVIQRLHQVGATSTGLPLGSVVDARVSGHEPGYSLTQLDLAGHKLFAPIQSHLAVGQTMQLYLPAKDIAVAIENPKGLSIRNSVAGVVASLHPDENDRVRVAIRVGDQMLIAQITRHAAEALALHSGMPVFALIKSVALD